MTLVEVLLSSGQASAAEISPANQEKLKKAEEKPGVCSRCNYRNGCSRGVGEKALRALLVDELMAEVPKRKGRPAA